MDNHLPNCSIHKPQAMTFPTEGEDTTLYYKDIRKKFPVPYVLYVEFEPFLQPSEGKNTVNEHGPSGFCCLKVSKCNDEIFPQYVYSGPDVMSHFYQHIYSEQETICKKLGIDKDMLLSLIHISEPTRPY